MIVAHADWSVDPGKRWLATARRDGAGWRVAAPVPVGDAAGLIDRVAEWADGAPAVLGLDLPIGLPRDYARRHACALTPEFPAFLRGLTDPAFFRVAAAIEEVGPARPFYPARGAAGMARAPHAAALGLADTAALLRRCDRAVAGRRAAAPLFWTLGPQQVGKAALHAWEFVLQPALMGPAPPGLWPFAGTLEALLTPGALVICEVYPADALRQLGLKMAGSKRRQPDRAALAAPLRAAMRALGAAPDRALAAMIADGFGAEATGEDRFDSVIGLLGMLGVLSGHRSDGVPDDAWVRSWEGWILGLDAPDDSAGITDTAPPLARVPSPG
ncbi:MAG: hypothetical protein JO047_17780 [Alphaproteobacteria bacterium]|nr:hypothetical protein [Alphaproteobacteria bacterium]